MRLFFFSVLLVFSTFSNLFAQRSFGGKPRSFTVSKTSLNTPFVEVLPAINMDLIRVEDSINQTLGKALRVGVMQSFECNFVHKAQKDTLTNGILYRMAIYSPEAKAMSVSFNVFDIPDGAELFVYNNRKDFLIGKFTNANMHEDKTFYTQSVEGDTLLIEYYEPNSVDRKGKIAIDEIGHLYKDIFTKNSSGSCEINVACSEGDNWQDQIKSIARMELRSTRGEIYMCSGALVNNVREDGTQYFLSANHCIEGMTVRSYVFYFNYQTYACKGTSGNKTNSVTGAVIKARNSAEASTDFLLLEITEQIPTNYDVYFAGWDTQATVGTVGACIHHPEGDWKKISIPRSVSSYSGSLRANFIYKQAWEVYWYSDNNKGVTEPGSSGSPLFNADKRIIGQLYGGYSDCDTTWRSDYFGKFSYSWSSASITQKTISSFLDPDNTGQEYTNTIPLALQEISFKQPQRVSVYPNPTSGYLHIISDVLGLESVTCYVYNPMGKVVQKQKLNEYENTLNLQNLSAGFYILEFITKGQKYYANVVVK